MQASSNGIQPYKFIQFWFPSGGIIWEKIIAALSNSDREHTQNTTSSKMLHFLLRATSLFHIQWITKFLMYPSRYQSQFYCIRPRSIYSMMLFPAEAGKMTLVIHKRKVKMMSILSIPESSTQKHICLYRFYQYAFAKVTDSLFIYQPSISIYY